MAARLDPDALGTAVRDFTALANAYRDAGDSELAGDRDAAEAVREVVATLNAFAKKRAAEDETRARAAITNGLRSVYLRVRGGNEGETEAPPSRRTWHEGAWQTDDERRAAIARMITRWLPEVPRAPIMEADLSAEEIDAKGGPRAAADAIVTGLFAWKDNDSASLRGATVFGLPLAF